MYCIPVHAVLAMCFGVHSFSGSPPCSIEEHKQQIPASARDGAVMVDHWPSEYIWKISDAVEQERYLTGGKTPAILCDRVPCTVYDGLPLGVLSIAYSVATGFTWFVSGTVEVEVKTGLATRLIVELGGSLSASAGVSGSTVETHSTSFALPESYCFDRKRDIFESKYRTSGTVTVTEERYIWRLAPDAFGHTSYFGTICQGGSASGDAKGRFSYRVDPLDTPCCDMSASPPCCGCYVEQ